MTRRNKKSICIIAHNAYGVLSGIDTGHSGGIEVQTPLMARWLTKNGYDVSMITWDEGIEDSGVIDGVRVHKLCTRDAGIRIIRFFYPRWSSFIRALRSADADLYYYNCGDLGLGQLVIWARKHHKKVIYSVASENDCYRDLSHLSSFRDRVMYKYGLKRADKIIVQTNRQKYLLEDEYGLESTRIHMPSKGYEQAFASSKERLASERPRILWVGRINPEKRLEMFLDLAELCPEYEFDVIGAENTQTLYGNELVKRAKALPNVVMHGRVKHENMGEYYKKASLLCSTSIYEGFPNVYLEAWSTGLPIITTFDPDGVIAENGTGKIAKDLDGLVCITRKMLDSRVHEKCSEAAKRYFIQCHAVDSSMEKFKEVFDRMV